MGAIDAIFSSYDTNKSNTLDAKLLNDAFKFMGTHKQISEAAVNYFVSAVDKSGEGKIHEIDVYEIFKQLLK